MATAALSIELEGDDELVEHRELPLEFLSLLPFTWWLLPPFPVDALPLLLDRCEPVLEGPLWTLWWWWWLC